MAKVPPVPAAILGATPNLRTREAMMVGSHLEGGWTPPFGVGDNGTSFGPYQMHEGGALTSSGLSPAQAEDPTLSTKAMMGAYKAAVNQISEATWSSNPELAAEESARIAEAPAQDYFASQGAGAVNSAWSDTQDVLTGKPSQGGMPTQQASTTSDITSTASGFFSSFLQGPQGIAAYLAQKVAGTALGDSAIGNGLTALYNALSDPVDVLERGALIVFGAIIILIGLVVVASGNRTVKGAASAATGAATRGVSTNIQGAVSGQAADRKQRMALAHEANQIGERKLALKEKREERLSASRPAAAPAVGRHRKAA